MDNKTDKQREFIELRAKGNSYDRISKKLNISKGTLMSWARYFDVEIGNRANLELETLLDKYKMSKLSQLEGFGLQLGMINRELKKRGLSDVPTHRLIELELKIFEVADIAATNGIRRPKWLL